MLYESAPPLSQSSLYSLEESSSEGASFWDDDDHDDFASVSVRSLSVLLLVLAGALLQLCDSGSPASRFTTTDTAMTSTNWDLPLLELVSSCFRSVLAMVLLMALGQVFVQCQASEAHHQPNNAHANINVILRDLVFHLQCRFVVGSLACLVPASIPTTAVDFGVLMVSTLSQRVFRPTMTTIATATVPRGVMTR